MPIIPLDTVFQRYDGLCVRHLDSRVRENDDKPRVDFNLTLSKSLGS